MERENPHGLCKPPSGRDFPLVRRQSPDAPEGYALLESRDKPVANASVAMGRAYEHDKLRRLLKKMGMTPVVPPKANRNAEWDCEQDSCKLRNEVERLSRRLKGYRRIYTWFGTFDVMFIGFMSFAFIVEIIYDLAKTDPN